MRPERIITSQAAAAASDRCRHRLDAAFRMLWVVVVVELVELPLCPPCATPGVLERVAEQTAGMSGSDVAGVVRAALMRPIRTLQVGRSSTGTERLRVFAAC